jgi:hypothetical protein
MDFCRCAIHLFHWLFGQLRIELNLLDLATGALQYILIIIIIIIIISVMKK